VDAARRFRQLYSRYNKARDLIALGAYSRGNDAELDMAVQMRDPMTQLLQQNMREAADLHSSVTHLKALVGGPNA
jgi:flagellum-specific ATP synthase